MADLIRAAAPSTARGHLAMLAFSALIAGSFALGGMIANDISPAALNAVRFLLGSAFMGAMVFATGGLPRGALRAPWRYVVLGALFSAYFVLMFESLKTAAPVSTAAIFTLTPLMSAVFGWLLMRQVTTRWMALALAVGAVGAVWVVFRADLAALVAFDLGRGEMVFFIGAVFHALFTPMLRLLNRGEPSLAYTFLFMSAGFLLLSAYGWSDVLATDWAALRPLVWVTVVYLALFAGAGSFFCLQYGARVLPSAKVMAYTYLTPSWVILWEIALGHGAPTLYVLGGVALTMVALLMLLREEA